MNKSQCSLCSVRRNGVSADVTRTGGGERVAKEERKDTLARCGEKTARKIGICGTKQEKREFKNEKMSVFCSGAWSDDSPADIHLKRM